ncbi:YtcA family lipoprotein [Steroidobacter cummioxidans]|uniref:YtcA family lipoprotein n=1 Tax=Steroidobacter cummioxidans TaxID=1803913 RepID=UPI0019D45FAF|nr:YtcA family lipoprotein [Steroidobacter cummioxidans]
MRRRSAEVLLIALISTGLSACALQGAPSFALFGAYFPDWMLVAALGILAAGAARVVMVATGLAEVIPFQLLTCVSVGVTISILVWLIWFAR